MVKVDSSGDVYVCIITTCTATDVTQTCGRRQWVEVTTEQYDLLVRVLDLMDDVPLSLHWCGIQTRVPLISWLTGIFRTAPAALSATSTSAAASRYTPSSFALSTPPSLPPGSQNSAALSSSTNQQTAAVTMTQTQTAAICPPHQIQGYILFGVQGGRRTLVPAQVPVYDSSSDYSVFKDLRKCYQAQRGRLRLWFSIWHLEYCSITKVIMFCKLLNRLLMSPISLTD